MPGLQYYRFWFIREDMHNPGALTVHSSKVTGNSKVQIVSELSFVNCINLERNSSSGKAGESSLLYIPMRSFVSLLWARRPSPSLMLFRSLLCLSCISLPLSLQHHPLLCCFVPSLLNALSIASEAPGAITSQLACWRTETGPAQGSEALLRPAPLYVSWGLEKLRARGSVRKAHL